MNNPITHNWLKVCLVYLFVSILSLPLISCGGGSGSVGGVTNPLVDSLADWHWRNPLPQGNGLNGVTYGNGTFVVVGGSGTIFQSDPIE